MNNHLHTHLYIYHTTHLPLLPNNSSSSKFKHSALSSMAELAALAAHFQTLKSQIPFMEMDPIFNNFTFSDHDPSLNFPFMMNFPSENFNFQAMEFPRNLGESSVSADGKQSPLFLQTGEQSPLFLQMNKDTVKAELHECNNKRKRKPTVDVSESSSGTTSSHVMTDKTTVTTNGRSRRRKIVEKEDEEPKEVVHVRARRGQATDSHSLAERVRRGKINERLKCLQNIVPGCYKTMGMAVMLDEIINYVQSLQNQVEFLSMKLAAASSFYEFKSEQEMERLMRIGDGGQGSSFSSATWQT